MPSTPRFTQALVGIYLLLSLVIFFLIWRATGHHFNYSLDDPYIHLAMARGIASGTYGINPGETSSPSSSVLWPFLLAPFVHLFGTWLPLLLNALFSVVACLFLGYLVRRWYLDQHPHLSLFFQLALATLLIITANLVGLTYVGMEHVLQIVLILGCCAGLVEAYSGNPIPRYALVMAALAPAVRYEDLAFTLAIALACLLQKRVRAALLTFGLSLLPLIGMSLFLHMHHLAPLPNSVLLKGGADYAGPHPLLFHLRTMALGFSYYFRNPGRMPITLMVVLLLALAWRERNNRLRTGVLLSAVLACLLMMFIGPYGWFYRYDVCLRVFSFLVLFGAAARSKLLPPAAALALAAIAAFAYLKPIVETAPAAREIYLEQRQMALFTNGYHEPVAVNDIGYISYASEGQYYVLDLYGLANPDALKTKNKTTQWMNDITHRHHTGLVMIYTDWFPPLPSSWTWLGDLDRTQNTHVVIRNSVSFYATPDADLPKLRTELTEFTHSLPPGVVFKPATASAVPPPSSSAASTPPQHPSSLSRVSRLQ